MNGYDQWGATQLAWGCVWVLPTAIVARKEDCALRVLDGFTSGLKLGVPFLLLGSRRIKAGTCRGLFDKAEVVPHGVWMPVGSGALKHLWNVVPKAQNRLE